jgi:TolB-like protein
MTRIRISIFLLLAFSAVSLFAQAKPRLAILPFTGGTGGDGETIAMLFSYEPELSSVFTIIPRTSSIEAIMREQQFQRSSGLTDSDTIARLGRQYNADYVIAGHIQTRGASKLVLITIIHVESLRQIAGDYKEYTDIEEVQNMIPGMARQITAASRTSGVDLPPLAVLPFAAPEGVDQGDAEVLAQLLAVEIANSGKYAVLPRTATIQSVMVEHQIQRSGITEADNIKKIGNALNAQYVLAGGVRSLGRTNLFTAEIINIENASQLAGNAVNYRVLDDGLKLMAELSVKLIGVKLRGTGSITVSSMVAGTILVDGRNTGVTVREGSPAIVPNVSAGRVSVAVQMSGGQLVQGPSVTVEAGGTANVWIERLIPMRRPIPANAAAARAEIPSQELTGTRSGGFNGRALGYGALNLALGLGSFIQRDYWAGGATILAGYGAAAGLIAWELSLEYEDDLAGIPGAVGLGVAGATALYGFIRPFIYEKHRALINQTDRISVFAAPGNSGTIALGLTYTLRF